MLRQPVRVCVYVRVCVRGFYLFLSDEQTEAILYMSGSMVLRESKWDLGVGRILTCLPSPGIHSHPAGH